MNSTTLENPRSYPSSYLWIALGTTFIIGFIQYHWNRQHLYILSRKVPGPKGWPIIGNMLDFTGDCEAIFDNIMYHFNSFPDLFKVWFGPSLVYAVSKPEYIKTILTNPKVLSRHELIKYVKPTLGDKGSFAGSVPVWKRHRKIILPTFNQQILNSYVEVFGRQATIMGQQLENYLGESEFNVYTQTSRCTLDILCETAMGISIAAQTSESHFGQWLDRLLEISFLRMFVIWYQSDFIFKQTKLYRDECELLEKYNSFVESVIKERRKTLEDSMDLRSNTKKSFLDLLLTSGDDKLTEDELRDEVKTFMVGGTDTTANALGYIFILLGLYPEIQERVYEEVLQVLGPEKMVEPQDLPNLEYTERVVKEALRLFPVGGMIGREIDEDLPITDDVILPGGSSVLIGVLMLHRDPKIWPNPLEFDPDRFLPEEVNKRHPFSYLPFSKGPRNCVGFVYAMMATKTILATVIRRFRFSTPYKSVEEVKLKTTLMVKPINGYRVSVELRK